MIRPNFLRHRRIEDRERLVRLRLDGKHLDAELVSLLDVFRDGDRLDELGGRMLVRQAFAEAGVLLPVGSSVDEALASDGERERAKVVAERSEDGQLARMRWRTKIEVETDTMKYAGLGRGSATIDSQSRAWWESSSERRALIKRKRKVCQKR